jgi:hypothetical protein
MKLIEKLAEDEWNKYVADKACCPEHLAKAMYEVAFRKALEMAAELLTGPARFVTRPHYGSEFQNAREECARAIKELGEEKV